jgi:class 3 adenylate cyclase
MDYTIVGRTVNIAQALEQCGREVMGHSEAVILVSVVTARVAGEEFLFEPCPQIVSGAIQAFRLNYSDRR